MSIPLNVIIYFALQNSQYQLPRYIPPLLGFTAIILGFIRNRIDQTVIIWTFISLLFLTGCFNLLLGLIDIASLWFVLAIIYALFVSKKNEALVVFIASFVVVLVVGLLMITKISFIPLQYKFESCQFACVAVRILHFLLMGSLVYYILKIFFTTIKSNVKDLELKSDDLEKLNIALKNEMVEKKEIQQKMIDTVIVTEEKERKRIASDLHDGLGPVLSAINLFFQAYIDADEKNKSEIETKLRSAIGDAIKDVSRISHNISPQILENFGLITALENFIRPIRESNKVLFDFDHCEMERLNHKDELIIYRTITELINNTLKHSGASQISLKLMRSDNELQIEYEDDGKGFDVRKKLLGTIGMGLSNIQSRISSLNGKIELESSPSNGMKVSIRIPYSAGMLNE